MSITQTTFVFFFFFHVRKIIRNAATSFEFIEDSVTFFWVGGVNVETILRFHSNCVCKVINRSFCYLRFLCNQIKNNLNCEHQIRILPIFLSIIHIFYRVSEYFPNWYCPPWLCYSRLYIIKSCINLLKLSHQKNIFTNKMAYNNLFWIFKNSREY